MGNCAGICNSNLLKLQGDIIIKSSSEQETNKFLEQNDIKKIIYLQRAIKKFLKRKKSKRKMKIKNKNNNNNINNSGKKVKQTKDIPTKNNKASKNSKKNKFITYDEEPTCELLIPTINTPLMEKNIFNDDPFRKKNRSNKPNGENNNINDPRDGPMDGIRRKFPKIKEDQSSYEGEWKDGKRDGYGILCWGDESKFMGKFEDDKVVGYGKLWHDDGDIYRGYWKEFQAEGIGVYKTKKGAYFKGEWKYDRQNGKLDIKENLKKELYVGLELSILRIREDMKDNGKTIKCMDLELSCGLGEMFLRENSMRIKNVDLVFFIIKKKFIWEIGKIINLKEM